MRTRLFEMSPKVVITLPALVLAGIVCAALVVGAGAFPAKARAGSCIDPGTVYMIWTKQHRPPLYSANNPQPDGCWLAHDIYESGSNYTDCAVVIGGYPSLNVYPHGSGTPTYTYDDTNPSHSNESSVIQSRCLGGGSFLGVEMEAPGSCSPNYQDRNTGFSVGIYLRELYCGGDAARDSLSCSNTATHGCIVNAGADVPTAYGGPCMAGTSACRSQMNTDFSNACANFKSGDTLGVYGNYALSYNDGGTDDAKLVASWINASINNYCVIWFT